MQLSSDCSLFIIVRLCNTDLHCLCSHSVTYCQNVALLSAVVFGLQAQDRIHLLREKRVPVTASQLGSVWHTIAFGHAAEADILAGPPCSVEKVRRRLHRLRAASCVIWMSSEYSDSFNSRPDAGLSGGATAAPRRLPVADPGGASSSRSQW